ncbi:hypothetical protein [Gorillibacterium sp. sgz5001074]|uniref:hypothetical protein n=1 Tax=Gorillibacterium sp. sgz5001074 TaxID=3446695 RepID=UPI003F66D7C8
MDPIMKLETQTLLESYRTVRSDPEDYEFIFLIMLYKEICRRNLQREVSPPPDTKAGPRT